MHGGIKFEESAWLEEYINLNARMGIETKQSENNFEQDFFQTNEQFCLRQNTRNIRNMVDIRFISSDKVAEKLAAKPNYDCCTIFNENLIAVHMKKTNLYFNSQSTLA